MIKVFNELEGRAHRQIDFTICKFPPNLTSPATFLFFLIAFLFLSHSGFARQQGGNYIYFDEPKEDTSYEFYSFLMSGDTTSIEKVHLKYFSYDAFSRYEDWKKDKRILLVTAGGFVDAPNKMGRPIGLAAEEGKIINRLPDKVMDGLLIIPSLNSETDVQVVDLDYTPTDLGQGTDFSLANLNPRENWKDNYPFFETVEDERVSVLQTQLIYSRMKGYELSFQGLDQGKYNRKRRYLVESRKNNKKYLTIAEPTSFSYLVNGAKDIYGILTDKGHEVSSILNLDTGSNNILHIFKNGQLVNKNPYNKELSLYAYHARIQNALNLLVFYQL